jgi:hypothetical protein
MRHTAPGDADTVSMEDPFSLSGTIELDALDGFLLSDHAPDDRWASRKLMGSWLASWLARN